MTCTLCRAELPTRFFGKRPDVAGGRDGRCKQCIREGSKFSIRMYHSLPRYQRLMKKWPDVQIQSEIKWLEVKIESLAAELERRKVKP